MKFSRLSLVLFTLASTQLVSAKEKQQSKKPHFISTVAYGAFILTPLALSSYAIWKLRQLNEQVQRLKDIPAPKGERPFSTASVTSSIFDHNFGTKVVSRGSSKDLDPVDPAGAQDSSEGADSSSMPGSNQEHPTAGAAL